MGNLDPEYCQPKSANTLSYDTVEFEHLCIMCHKCIGYRQDLADSKCWLKSTIPSQIALFGQQQWNLRKCKSQMKSIEINWEALFCLQIGKPGCQDGNSESHAPTIISRFMREIGRSQNWASHKEEKENPFPRPQPLRKRRNLK